LFTLNQNSITLKKAVFWAGPLFLYLTILHILAYGKGLILTDDSLHYLAAAQRIQIDFLFIDNSGNYFLFWPPLFPMILSFFQGHPTLYSLFNFLIMASVCIYFYLLVARFLQTQFFRIATFLFVAVGVHLLLVSTLLWTELIFIFCLLGFTFHFLKWSKGEERFYMVLLFGTAMCLQRNAGVFFLAGIALWSLFFKGNSLKSRWEILKITAFSAIGWVLWNIFTWVLFPHPHFTFETDWFQHWKGNMLALLQSTSMLLSPIKYTGIICWVGIIILAIKYLKNKNDHQSEFRLIISMVVSYFILLSAVFIINIGGFPVDFGEADRFLSVTVPFLSLLIFIPLESYYLHS
jgi:hypothetical protein